MATKTISITEDAYDRLAVLRAGNESFSEIISRITNKAKLNDFFGILSKDEADKLGADIKQLRKVHRKSHAKRIKRIRKVLN